MEELRLIVRAILAVMVIATVCFLTYIGKVSSDAFLPIALIIIQFFFKDKSKKNGKGKKEIK